MKKTLIPALLVVSAAFAPFLRNAVEFPDRVGEVVQEVARPVFWHLWDQLLTREIAQRIEGDTRADEAGWHAGLQHNVVACIFFQIVLKHAFDGSLTVAKENNPNFVSISSALVRRMVGREFPPRSMLGVLTPERT
jgi:hypothetical protein